MFDGGAVDGSVTAIGICRCMICFCSLLCYNTEIAKPEVRYILRFNPTQLSMKESMLDLIELLHGEDSQFSSPAFKAGIKKSFIDTGSAPKVEVNWSANPNAVPTFREFDPSVITNVTGAGRAAVMAVVVPADDEEEENIDRIILALDAYLDMEQEIEEFEEDQGDIVAMDDSDDSPSDFDGGVIETK